MLMDADNTPSKTGAVAQPPQQGNDSMLKALMGIFEQPKQQPAAQGGFMPFEQWKQSFKLEGPTHELYPKYTNWLEQSGFLQGQ
jgi:hypothetical protein